MKITTLPPDIEFHEDIRLFVHRPRGLLNEIIFDRTIAALGKLEEEQKEPFNRFVDTFAADEVELNFRYMFHVSLYRRLSYANRPPIRTALLVTHSTIAHYGKLHEILTQGSPIKVRIFQDRVEAANWLRVPIERLEGQPLEMGNK
jgi:hypothetical protein